MEELVVLTRGQEALYKYLLFSEATVEDRLLILDRMIEIFPSPEDRKYLRLIQDAAIQTRQFVGYEYLVERDFPYHLSVQDGEKVLSSAEAHLTLVEEVRVQERRKASSDLMSISRHLIECRDHDECAKGKCQVFEGAPLQALDRISIKLAGGIRSSKPLRFVEIYEERKNRPLGAQTFIAPFDEKIQGLEPGNLLVVAGWTGSYKTTFGLNMVHGNAVKSGYNAVFISSEIPKEILYLYLLCRHSYEDRFSDHGPVHRMETQKATLSDEDYTWLKDVVEPDLLTNPDYGKIEILDETDFDSLTPGGIKAKLLSLDFDVDILLYDYIQLIKFMEDAREVAKGGLDPVNYYVRVFTDMAMHLYGGRHKLLAVLLSQINREGWKKAVENDGEYDITCLAEANELERSAFYVVTLFSDQNLKESGELKGQLLKHRGGETQIDSVLTPLDSRYLALGSGIEGYGETESSDMSGLLMSSGDDSLFGDFQ